MAMDDDDLLSGPLEGLAAALTDDVDVLLWPRATILVQEDGSMGWRRPEMRCIFATNCALRKSFLRRHFDRDGLLRVLADHRAANDAVGDVLGVDTADFVLPGFRRLRHPRVGFVAHEWSLKNGHVGSIQQLQQALRRDDPPAFLRGLALEVQRPLPGWAEPFALDIEALASVWSALRASVRQTAGAVDHGGECMTSRREFLAGLAATGLGAAACVRYPFPGGPRKLPDPKSSGLDHIVVLCMENRSFDHYLGWVRGATGRQTGLACADEQGVAHPTHRLASFTGCGFNDPSHSYNGGRIRSTAGPATGSTRQQRRPRARLLHPGGPAAHQPARRPLHDLRPLVRRLPGPHLPEPLLHPLGRHRPHHQHPRGLDDADSGIGSARPASRPATTTPTSRSWRSTARSTSARPR